MGIQRIVPPSERKTERTYSGKFISVKLDEDTKNEILAIISRVLGRKYTSLDLRTVNKRRLFVVDRKTNHYSGFNMGAGENAMFSLLTELFASGRNSLIVVDEIELGLHEEAQKRLIDELKKICKKMHCQIICSTHSANILDALPPEGRFFVESEENRTIICEGISSAYAMGRLNGGESKEVVIFTEDEVGMAVVQGCLPQNVRERVHILPIGSDQAVLRQLSARYRERKMNCIAFLDGDKKRDDKQARKQVYNYLEGRVDGDFEEWLNKRLCYLPGDDWPEKFLIEISAKETISDLAEIWQINNEKLVEFFDESILAGKHNELFCLSRKLSQDMTVVRNDIIRVVSDKRLREFANIENLIRRVLVEI